MVCFNFVSRSCGDVRITRLVSADAIVAIAGWKIFSWGGSVFAFLGAPAGRGVGFLFCLGASHSPVVSAVQMAVASDSPVV